MSRPVEAKEPVAPVHGDGGHAPDRGRLIRQGQRLGSVVRQPLFANAGYLWAINLAGALAGFVFWGIAARLYPPEEVGVGSAVISTVALLANFSWLGVGTGLVRFLPETPHPRRLLNTAFSFNALTALVIAGVYLAGIPFWSPALSGLRSNGLYAAGFVVYTMASTVGNAVQMAFVARRRAGYALVQTGIAHGGRLVLVGLLVGMGAAGLVASVASVTLLAVVLSLLFFLPRVEPSYRPRPDLLWGDLAAILPYSAGSHVAQLLAQTSQMVLPLLILEMLGPTLSGYAYIAWMLGAVLYSPGLALANSAFAEGSNEPGSLSAVLSRATVAGLALTAAGALIVAAGAPWVLSLFGPGYALEGSALLRWLALAALPAVLTRLYFTRLQVEKRIGQLILLSGAIAALTLGLAAALMPRYGIAASGVGWLLGNGMVAVLALARMGRDGAGSQT